MILGAGFGGLTLAQSLEPLASEGKAEVTLLDRSARFSIGFTKQWALIGRRPLHEGERPYTSLRAPHVRFIQEEIVEIDLRNRVVRTPSGSHPYDRLVVALGVELAPSLVPGLEEAAHNLYDPDSVLRFRPALEAFAGGTLAIVVASLPFKCPPAPYEYAMLIDDLLRQRGAREGTRLRLITPEPRPMAVAGEAVGRALEGLLEEGDIEYLPNRQLVRVDGRERTLYFEEGAPITYDLLGAVPPHRAPGVVRDAGLTDGSGFVPAELGTFRTASKGVYAVGDVASLRLPDGRPHPKAGAFAEAQARTVAEALRSELVGGAPGEYEGRGACYVETTGDRAAAAEVHLLAEGGPQAELQPPSPEGLERKRRFERERFDAWFGG